MNDNFYAETLHRPILPPMYFPPKI